MLENQFIKFGTEFANDAFPVPVVLGKNCAFYVPLNVDSMSIVSLEGERLATVEYESRGRSYNYVKAFGPDGAFYGTTAVSVGDCFYLVASDAEEQTEVISNVLQIVESSYVPVVKETLTLLSSGATGGTFNLDFGFSFGAHHLRITAGGAISVDSVQTQGADLPYTQKAGTNQTDIWFSCLDEYTVYIQATSATGGIIRCYEVSEAVEEIKTADVSLIEYRCSEQAFGFPVPESEEYVSAWVPLRIHAPQYAQEDKTYTKLDGGVVTLYSQHRKEWSGETDYVPEDLHNKIVAALSCDEVYINGVRVTKSGEYSVDWDNYAVLSDETKLVRATFKVQANTLYRNSNY